MTNERAKGVAVQAFGIHFWKNVERHFLKKLSPNIVDKNVATILQKNLSLDSIIYLNHLKLIKNYNNKAYGSMYRFFPILAIFHVIDLFLFNVLLELIFLIN